jgi:ABC-type oligopeptide transport system ATPase subunit
MNKVKCFISYARNDVDKLSLELFMKQISEIMKDHIRFLYDEDLPIGVSLEDYMKEIFNVDVVIMILTPEYKKRTESRVKTGIGIEFTYILSRYEELLENTKDKNIPFLIPVVFSGHFNDVCPSQITHLLALDFSKYIALKNESGHYYIPNRISNFYKKDFERIAASINTHISFGIVDDAINEENTGDKNTIQIKHDELREILFEDKKLERVGSDIKSEGNLRKVLFELTKHDQTKQNIALEGNYDEIFIETHAYAKLEKQLSYIFIGRKGCGKSTLPDLLYVKNKKNYKGHIEININYIKMEQAFNYLYNSRIEKDIDMIFSASYKYFQYAWEIFIYICCIEIIYQEYLKGNLIEEQKKYIRYLRKFLETNFEISKNDNKLNKSSIYSNVLSRVNNYLEFAITSTREDNEQDFIYDFNLKTDRQKIISSVIGQDVINAVYKIIERCKRRILISFDGFDNEFENFRKQTILLENKDLKVRRYKYEVDFLRGFLHYIIKSKENYNYSLISSILDFCVTVPQERFAEVLSSDRDSYRYINKYNNIRWSGIELAIMLRKRLEFLKKVVVPKEKSQMDKLSMAIINYNKNIPLETTINIGGREYKKHIFLEILRHSFWRPREILLYFIKIALVIEEFIVKNLDVGEFSINYIISKITIEIIDNEFIAEFKNHCLNLERIIDSFFGCKQIISYSQLENIIGHIHFKFVYRETEVKDLDEKIKFLYEIGFLGIELPEEMRQSHRLEIKDIFCFNETTSLFKIIQKNNYRKCKFVIHPIFCEKLALNIQDQRLVLDYTWEYLEYQERCGIMVD